MAVVLPDRQGLDFARRARARRPHHRRPRHGRRHRDHLPQIRPLPVHLLELLVNSQHLHLYHVRPLMARLRFDFLSTLRRQIMQFYHVWLHFYSYNLVPERGKTFGVVVIKPG